MVAALNRLKISFKQAFAGVMAISMLFALILSWIINSTLVNYIQIGLNNKSPVQYKTVEHALVYDTQMITHINEMNKSYEVMLALNSWIPLVLFSLSTVLASYIFFLWKMKTPLKLLNDSIKKIHNKELDFTVQYNAKDEMGALIDAFECMRKELHNNFILHWKADEDRKLHNATFAHDIRTPLTILKGQVDVLLRNVKAGKSDFQKVIETLNLLARNIVRIEKYTDEMRTLQSLDEIQVHKKQFLWDSFWSMIQDSLVQLAEAGGKKIFFDLNIETPHIYVDEYIITRILDNVVTNAIRYTEVSIKVYLQKIDTNLIIKVCDDGPGFSQKSLHHALEPFFYERTPNNDHQSNGLGLYICKTLIERHGGTIKIANGPFVGGCVVIEMTSVFQ